MKKNLHNKTKVQMISMISLLVLVAIIFIIAPSIWGKSDLGFARKMVQELKYWHIEDMNGTRIELPNSIKAEAGETVRLTTRLPKPQGATKSICIRSSQQKIKVYFNGVLYPLEESFAKHSLGKSQGSSWIIVDVPDHAKEGIVTIEVTSPYRSTSGTISSILYGDRSDILLKIFKHNSYSLLVAVIGLLSGIICSIQYFLSRKEKEHYNRIFYLGIFDFVASIWILSESQLLQFICSDHFFIANISYFSLLVLPIPFIYYVDSSYQSNLKLKEGSLAHLFYINFIVVVGLQLCKIADLFETLISIHVLILITALIGSSSLLIEVVKYKNKEAKNLLNPILVLLCSGIMELVSFYTLGLGKVSMFFETGLLLFMIINGVYSIKSLNQYNKTQMEAQIYCKLAFKDILTGGKNRNAYEVEIKEHESQMDDHIWLIMFDANNLKKINDSFGHAYGDQMLNKMYTAIVDCFGEQGSCYRIGGDEFALLYHELNPGDCLKRIEQFIRDMDAQKDEPAAFDTAIGFVQFDKKQYKTFHKLEMEADRRMYQDKLKKKQCE